MTSLSTIKSSETEAALRIESGRPLTTRELWLVNRLAETKFNAEFLHQQHDPSFYRSFEEETPSERRERERREWAEIVDEANDDRLADELTEARHAGR